MAGKGMISFISAIFSGVRFYFPEEKKLPVPASEVRSYAIINVREDGYMLLESTKSGWFPATTKVYKDYGSAIEEGITLSCGIWEWSETFISSQLKRSLMGDIYILSLH
ncbi:hypothetical protein KUF61_24450 [Klebsiella aerogenes]|uniref:hypothetical protein n=1 Tax=Klebsiella aerogenes TaxID=548 RepID=UPI001C38B86D|nr:hypothetical protein [Klebsiella aerogenes]MBV2179505.1 hypothetical protein [Klebsiella aerogenes]